MENHLLTLGRREFLFLWTKRPAVATRASRHGRAIHNDFRPEDVSRRAHAQRTDGADERFGDSVNEPIERNSVGMPCSSCRVNSIDWIKTLGMRRTTTLLMSSRVLAACRLNNSPRDCSMRQTDLIIPSIRHQRSSTFCHCNTRRREHITAVLEATSWAAVRQRIEFNHHHHHHHQYF